MEFIALCHPGTEEALIKELESYEIKATRQEGGATFTAHDKTVANLVYHVQTATRIIASLDAENLEQAHKYIPEDATFKVEAEIIAGGPTDTTSTEMAAELGSRIDRPVDLDNPDFVVFAQIGTQTLCGIDIAGDLSKRYYRIFTNARSLKATIAASLAWQFGEGVVLDPFGGSGEIAIECAMRMAGVAPLKFEKHRAIALVDDAKDWSDEEREPEGEVLCYDPQLGNMRNSQKNAKMAGVEKIVQFSKIDAEWLDVKCDEKSITRIITTPPPVSRKRPDDAHLKELCYQAEWILKEDGLLVVVCLTEDTMQALASHAKTYKFKLQEEYVFYSGMLPLHIVVYGM